MDADADSARLAQIEGMHAEVLAKHSKLRLLLAHKSLGIATKARHIDDVPTRTELLQYERRFVELYEQVAAKLEETRKYYDTYNVLEQKRNFLQMEVDQIKSIHDNFSNAFQGGAKSQTQFIVNMGNVIKGLDGTKGKITAKLTSATETHGKANLEYVLTCARRVLDVCSTCARRVVDVCSTCARRVVDVC